MVKKISPKTALIFMSILIAALAILLVVFAVTKMNSYDKIILIVCGVVLFLIAALIWYIIGLSYGKKYNFFLYDKKRKSEIDIKDLNFDIIEKRLNLYFSAAFSLFKTNSFTIFTNSIVETKIPEVFIPLIMPFVFWSVVKGELTDQLALLFKAEKSLADNVENELFAIGAIEISSRIQSFRSDFKGDEEATVTRAMEFFKEKQEYLENFIRNYIVTNIEKF